MRQRSPITSLAAVATALLALAWSAGGAVAQPAQPVPPQRDWVEAPGLEERVRQTITELSAWPSRMPGYPGGAAATEWVADAFRDLGLEDVAIQPFTVTVPVETSCTLSFAGETHDIHAFWPNHTATAQTPPGGLSGEMVDAGEGDIEQLSGHPIDGQILLYDVESGVKWHRALSLGAAAILFIEPEDAVRKQLEDKWLSVPAPLPRYWVPRELGLRLRETLAAGETVEVTIHCDMEWRAVETGNVWGVIPGTGVDQEFKKDPGMPDPVLLLTAHYDAGSAVPALAPGAEAAASVAGLLEVARALQANPPGQRVVMVATGGHYQALSGIGSLLRAFDLAKGGGNLPGDIDPEGVESEAIRAFVAPYFGFVEDEDKPEVNAISLDLSSHGLKILYGNRANYDIRFDLYRDRKYGLVGRRIEGIAKRVTESMGEEFTDVFVDTTNPVHGRIESFFDEDVIFESEIFALITPSFYFATGNDSRPHIGTPHDLPRHVDFNNLARQIRILVNLLPRLTDQTRIWRDVTEDYSVRGALYGDVKEMNRQKSVVPIDPVPDTILYVRQRFGFKGQLLRTYVRPVYGIQMAAVAISDASGNWQIPWFMWPEDATLDAFTFDDDGTITHAANLGVEGDARFSFRHFHMGGQGGKKLTVVPSEFNATTFPELVDPRYLLSFKFLSVLNAKLGGEPHAYGLALPVTERYDTSYVEPVLMVFTPDDNNLQIIMSLGLIGRNLIFINATEEKPEGIGIPTDRPRVVKHLPLKVARDMWMLDEYRLNRWAQYGIINERLNSSHAEAAEYIAQAEEARDARQWDSFYGFAHSAWAAESRVYPDVAATANDVVRGVIFYLALCIPFAYCAERLLFCYGDIRHQIAAAVGIFLAIVLILGFVHPAFQITLTPYVIFLAFAITTLAGVIIFILIGRFREEFRIMRGGVLATYATEASTVGALLAGINLGIGMMRRRAMRTILTVITLVILTFAILSFTSVKPFIRFNEHRLPYGAAYEGILYRNFDWTPLETPEVEALENALSDSFHLSRRAWLVSNRPEEQLAIQVALAPKQEVPAITAETPTGILSAMVGLDPRERLVTNVEDSLVAGAWLPEEREDVCLVPANLAEVLGGGEDLVGRHLLVYGRPLEIVGIFDDERWNAVRDLSDGPLSPVNFVQLRPQARDRLAQTDPSEVAETQYLYLQPSTIIVTNHAWLLDHGGTYRSLAGSAHPNVDIKEYIENLMQRWSIAITAGIEEKAWVFSSIGASSLKGLGGLLIPVIIGSLIILNALLGSVFEREREIWTYSSLGVPQKMIGMLFMAEAGVYGILGAVLGYLVGQGVAKVITTFELLGGLTLNYSSTSAFLSMALVIVVTLISAIYPARKAYLSANPGFLGLMAKVEPVDDTWYYDLPFVVHQSQALALNNFLVDFFDSHKEEAVGVFTTGDVEYTIERSGDGGEEYRIEFDCWLAPYDFGVSHHVALWTTQDLEQDMKRYQMTLHRLSGDISSCQRANREFLLALRKRMLIWRILKDEDREEYRRMYQPEVRQPA